MQILAGIITESQMSEYDDTIDENTTLSPEEKKIVDDILGGANSINEGTFDSVLEKVKSYLKKGMITAGILATLLATPGISSAQQSAIKDIAKTEMSTQNNNDVSKMDNTKLYNLFVKTVKSNPDAAMSIVDKMKGSNQEETNDINMLKTFVKSIKDGSKIENANYMGKRLKMASKFTQQLINSIPAGAYVGGWGK
jgi:hypothetical protein